MNASETAPPPETQVPATTAILGDEAELLVALTARQRRFVEEYIVDFNATQAAIRAGYSPKSAKDIGYENLRKQDIVDAIAAVMAKRSQRTGVNRTWVLTNLVDAHDTAKGKDTAAHLASRLKALELIGRHVDVRAFRVGLGFSGGDEDDDRTIWDMSRLTDAEFETFERLLKKVAVIEPHSGGAGSSPEAQGPGAHSAAPRGDSGDM